VLRTGTSLPKALQAELDRLGASYTCGQCDDPNAEARTSFHLFQPAGAPASIATILFHGTGNDALFCWENIILDLLKSGRAVFTFDLPGHGQDSSTILSEASFARCAAFLPRLLPELLPSLQETEAIAYSLGALAALQQMTQSAMPWRSLVLMAIPERVHLTPAFLTIEALSFFKGCWWQQLKTHGWDASFPAFAWIRRSRFPIRMDPNIRMSYPEFVGHLLKSIDVRAELMKLKIPTLLIYGTRDYLATAAYGESLGKTCATIEGANHFLLPLRMETRTRVLDWLTSST
jgi:pimeloyl-ACP methyl ester carboxylesterase